MKKIITSYSQALEWILHNQNTITLPTSQHDIALMSVYPAYEKVDAFTPDGKYFQWFLSLKMKQYTQRVYGPSLLLHLLPRLPTNLHQLFFGSSSQTLSGLKLHLEKLHIDTTYFIFCSPPYNKTPKQLAKICLSFMKKHKIDIVWLGFSSPLQVQVAAEIKKSAKNIRIICVGAAFDFLSGTKPQAPTIIQNLGLEWLFRLLSEPKRLGKRYLITIPSSLLTLIFNKKKRLYIHKILFET